MGNSNAEKQIPAVIASLRRFARPRIVTEQCDLCSIGLTPEHQHLFEPDTRQLFCSCDACSLLFSSRAETKYKRVPRQVYFLPDFYLSDSQWDDLLIPIGMAFFFHSSSVKKTMAFYPSPAGSVESLLELETWQELETVNPFLREMESDVEALLVNRIGEKKEHFLAPIDKCFELVGLIRMKWQGLSGGIEVWETIENFFGELKDRAIIKQVSNPTANIQRQKTADTGF